MKTIYMVCRSKKETPRELIRLMESLFPECEVQIVYEGKSNSTDPGVKSPAFSPHGIRGGPSKLM